FGIMKILLKFLSLALFVGFLCSNMSYEPTTDVMDFSYSVYSLKVSGILANAEDHGSGGGTTGCTADDPGECVAACNNGTTPCCVGESPNCSQWPSGLNPAYIECGNGTIWC